MSERENKQPADVLQEAVCTLEDAPLRILQPWRRLHFHSFGVGRLGPWVTSVNRRWLVGCAGMQYSVTS